MYGISGTTLGGMYNKPAEMPAPPNWLSYVLVPDVKKVVEAVKRANGTLCNGPMEVPGGDLIAQFLDPQGAAFAVHAKKAVVKTTGAKKAPAKKGTTARSARKQVRR